MILTESDLYLRTNYKSKDEVIVNRIVEYDIRQANVSMLRWFRAITPEQAERLGSMTKHNRQVTIGKLERKKPELKSTIAEGITDAKFLLFLMNGIVSEEVQAIRNDAVYIIGRRLHRTSFADGIIQFREKNVYSVYLEISGIEFYYSGKTDKLDVKGIGDSTLTHPDHQNGILAFIRKVMQCLHYERMDDLHDLIVDYGISYKRKTLPLCNYRELNPQNIYRTEIEFGDYSLNFDVVGEEHRDMLNGIYNYKTFVLPLIQRFL